MSLWAGVDRSVNVVAIVLVRCDRLGRIHGLLSKLCGRAFLHTKKLSRERKRRFLRRVLQHFDFMTREGLELYIVVIRRSLREARASLLDFLLRLLSTHDVELVACCTNLDTATWSLSRSLSRRLSSVRVVADDRHELVQVTDVLANLYRYCRDCVFGRSSHEFVRRLSSRGRVVVV